MYWDEEEKPSLDIPLENIEAICSALGKFVLIDKST